MSPRFQSFLPGCQVLPLLLYLNKILATLDFVVGFLEEAGSEEDCCQTSSKVPHPGASVLHAALIQGGHH